MILLNAEAISKSHRERMLLDGVGLAIGEGDKVGLIGVNGTGKSTFLKILAGVEEPEGGTVTTGRGVRIGYLPQDPVFDGGLTVLEQVLAGVAPGQRDTKEFEAKSLLTRLGLERLDQRVATLSGGQKKRVAMAAALAAESELLILDEPTNHIDSSMVDWLESRLAAYPGAILMVTHDRYFLERVANRIVELDGGRLYSYPASYSQYLELKTQRQEMALASERKRQSLLRRELEWMRRGAKARGTKARFRQERFEQLCAAAPPPQAQTLELAAGASRMGKKTIELDGICKAYDGRELIRDFSYVLLRRDRLGILGPNGCGKSTLLRMIAGVAEPDSGCITVGETIRLGYFSQEGEGMDPDARPIDYLKDIAPEVQTDEGTLTAAQLMERFLFDDSLAYGTIGRLSGGERRRLCLLGVLMASPNVLLLDEPTNDLDIQTLTILEEYLEQFPGAVITVSHDRCFLDRVVDHVLVYQGDGRIVQYNGGYTDYISEYKEEKKAKERPAARTQRPAHEQKLRMSYREQKEFDTIDEDIAALEGRIEALGREMEQSSADFVRLQELMDERSRLEQELSHKMERWVYLNDLHEAIAAGQKA